MWQRLQTLYLALGLALIVPLFFCNFFSFEAMGDGEYPVTEFIRYREMGKWGLYLIMLIVVTLLQLLCISAFKARMVQMWLVIFNALVLVGFQVLIVFDIIKFNRFVTAESIEVYKVAYVTSVFPVVVSILNFLAAKNIMLDEAMVQSASRLRSARKRK